MPLPDLHETTIHLKESLVSETVQLVKKYYGETLQSGKDLLTDACCTSDAMPAYAREILAAIHPEVKSKYYGCGLVLPEKLNGAKILDLGSGAGQDCFILSKLVGETGSVVGVDMTDEQLEVARQHEDFHRQAFGYQTANTKFLKGYLEKLDELDLPENHFDVIVSNCVINLCEDKEAVLKACHRLLKEGGEVYFSDVYSDRRIPESLRKDPILYGECLSGALYHRDFIQLAQRSGFSQPRRVKGRPLAIRHAETQKKLGAHRFHSVTYRLFKVAGLEQECEDYGQAVKYMGTLPQAPDQFALDESSSFETGKVTPVCGSTFDILKASRFAGDFQFYGDNSVHFGPFACGGSSSSQAIAAGASSQPGASPSGSCC